ncbi:MAG: phage head closure protein [Parvibaculaceae bacterium]
MTRIGRLRHRLTLEAPVTDADDIGGRSVAWTPVATMWAAIETVNGKEIAALGQTDAQLIHRITIRHRDGVGPAMRLRKGARIFEIVSVRDPDGRKRFLVIHAIERTLA